MKQFFFAIIMLFIGFIIGYWVAPQERVVEKTVKDIQIVRQESSQEIKYKECLDAITMAINPWSGSIRDYPANDFKILVDQCMQLKIK